MLIDAGRPLSSALIFWRLQSGLIAAGLLDLQPALLVEDFDLSITFIAVHVSGDDLGLIFFARNCLPTAILIIRSGFVPRVLGVGVDLSGLVYLAGSVLRFLAPGFHGLVAPACVIPLIAEPAFCLWLFDFAGAR